LRESTGHRIIQDTEHRIKTGYKKNKKIHAYIIRVTRSRKDLGTYYRK